MSSEVAKGDQNHYRVIQGVTNDGSQDLKMIRVDPTTLGLLIAGAVSAAGYSTVTSGSATNSTTNTAAGVVAISTPCKAVVVSVPINNTGTQVAVGGNNVNATAGSEVGHIVIRGANQIFYISDASQLYWVPDTANDKISYNIFN